MRGSAAPECSACKRGRCEWHGVRSHRRKRQRSGVAFQARIALQPTRQPLATRLQLKNQWAPPAALLQETDHSVHQPAGLLEDATELNQGPHRTRKASTPAQALERLLSGPPKLPVATIP